MQRPANDTSSNVTTTHFDYHSISGRLLKLDLLGHDVPTIIRMLYDSTGVDPVTVPLNDAEVLSLFTSPRAMGVTPEGLMPPLCTIQGLGLSVAQSIVEARADGEFYTVAEFRDRTKINKTVTELLKQNGVLDGIPETDQMSLW